MDLLKPNTVDAAQEKHVPVVRREGDKLIVEVGSVHHPMTQEHYIPYIWVVFDNKVGRAHLTPDDEPVAEFFPGEGPLKVYGYCCLLYTSSLKDKLSDGFCCKIADCLAFPGKFRIKQYIRFFRRNDLIMKGHHPWV